MGKLLLRLALPTITAQLVNALYNMVDRIYIGHIPVVGRTALTGVGVCMSLIMIISAFAALTAMGGATRASIFLGRGDRAGAEKILYFNVIGSVVFLALFYTLDAVFHFSVMEEPVDRVRIALVHTGFNLAATAFMLPLSKWLEKLAV